MNDAKYRTAECRLLEAAGVIEQPTETWLELPRLGGSVRVLQVGEGVPALFFAGGPMVAATWSYVAARTQGIRWHLVDRPGTGLSPARPMPPNPATLPGYVADLAVDVLDALECPQASIVGSSFGGYLSLRAALVHPDRFERLVLAGCPAFVPGWTQPEFFTLLRMPVLGRAMLALPASKAGARFSLKALGHRQSLRARTIPPAMIEWTKAWQQHTDTMRNDAAMIRACGSWRRGFEPELDLDADTLASVQAPCLILGGTDDVVGDEGVVRALEGQLGDAVVDMRDGAGHLPWLDDPQWAADAVMRHLVGACRGR